MDTAAHLYTWFTPYWFIYIFFFNVYTNTIYTNFCAIYVFNRTPFRLTRAANELRKIKLGKHKHTICIRNIFGCKYIAIDWSITRDIYIWAKHYNCTHSVLSLAAKTPIQYMCITIAIQYNNKLIAQTRRDNCVLAKHLIGVVCMSQKCVAQPNNGQLYAFQQRIIEISGSAGKHNTHFYPKRISSDLSRLFFYFWLFSHCKFAICWWV